MTKTFRASGREYQRSPYGVPDGVISNPLARETSNNGEFVVTNEGTRIQLQDTTASFSTAVHQGRLLTFPMSGGNTPPSGGLSGTRLHNGWSFRIKTVVSPTILELEGFRAEFAGTSITYVIHAAADFTAASGAFPADTGPTGTGADGVNRSNTGPVEWQCLQFPLAADSRLRIYPFWITRRSSTSAVRISDPFDNLTTFPTESSLTWFLRDRPAYTYEQLFKIIHQFLLHCGWALNQHRGNNNGVGAGGNATNQIFCVHDMVYFSEGEDGKTPQYLKFGAYHRNNSDDGTDSVAIVGFDMAMASAWDRAYPSVAIPGSTGQANLGQGINMMPLTTITTNLFAGQDHINTSNNLPHISSFGGAGAAGQGALHDNVRWSHPKDTTVPRTIQNTLNTPEGGDISEVRYYMFGDKDEVQIYLENPGSGFHHVGLGNLKTRPDAQAEKFKTNFTTPNGSNVLLRIGGPGTSNGVNPSTTTIPHQVGDRIQTVGMRVLLSPTIVPGTSFPGELIDSSTITALPGLVQAIGILICDTVANISDGSLFTLNDGLAFGSSVQIYEFDKNGVFVQNRIDLQTGAPTTADQVRDRIRDGVNPLLVPSFVWNGSTTVTSTDTSGVVVGDWIWLTTSITNQLFRITAINPNVSVTIENPDSFTIPSGSGASTTRKSKQGIKATNAVSARVDLTNGRKGGAGNVLIIDSSQEFLTGTEGMSGGGFAIEIASLTSPIAAGALVGEDPQALFFFRPSAMVTPFSTTGGTQGIFRVNNRSANANATYRDHNGPTSVGGFDALAELAGLFGPDTREINPNERTGRMGAVTVSCKDTVGGQLRGSMRYGRITTHRLGAYQMKRDRNGDWHMVLPFSGRFNAAGDDQSTNDILLVMGPMPTAMAFVS